MNVLHSQVKLVNIRNDDIADGNPKLTLGLIWTIILHFQVSFSVSVMFHYFIAVRLCLWDLNLSAAASHLLGANRSGLFRTSLRRTFLIKSSHSNHIPTSVWCSVAVLSGCVGVSHSPPDSRGEGVSGWSVQLWWHPTLPITYSPGLFPPFPCLPKAARHKSLGSSLIVVAAPSPIYKYGFDCRKLKLNWEGGYKKQEWYYAMIMPFW